jgi:hypothetical protein
MITMEYFLLNDACIIKTKALFGGWFSHETVPSMRGDATPPPDVEVTP